MPGLGPPIGLATVTVDPGSVTGLYYIPVGNLPVSAQWQQLKDFLMRVCSVENVEIYPAGTGGWVRLRGPVNFQAAYNYLKANKFQNRFLLLGKTNETGEIPVRMSFGAFIPTRNDPTFPGTEGTPHDTTSASVTTRTISDAVTSHGFHTEAGQDAATDKAYGEYQDDNIPFENNQYGNFQYGDQRFGAAFYTSGAEGYGTTTVPITAPFPAPSKPPKKAKKSLRSIIVRNLPQRSITVKTVKATITGLLPNDVTAEIDKWNFSRDAKGVVRDFVFIDFKSLEGAVAAVDVLNGVRAEKRTLSATFTSRGYSGRGRGSAASGVRAEGEEEEEEEEKEEEVVGMAQAGQGHTGAGYGAGDEYGYGYGYGGGSSFSAAYPPPAHPSDEDPRGKGKETQAPVIAVGSWPSVPPSVPPSAPRSAPAAMRASEGNRNEREKEKPVIAHGSFGVRGGGGERGKGGEKKKK
ncbi:hypothetical protein B0H67DRAFT_555334 [Lasiosphaeris hirsuta]|uniref:RRM domain-containing protein n=1 Tax=Lasiosphaeris hirsuta TaxID=260670 RepID=A0AA40A914_9PEZI|nr:hypothetical protein B0H67DRAFT_555334 [Lasiosphaeris hirsuta]